jgi:hypothetical protein
MSFSRKLVTSGLALRRAPAERRLMYHRIELRQTGMTA